MVYFLLFASVLLLTGFSQITISNSLTIRNKEQELLSHYLLFCSFMLMFLISSIRKDVGVDYIQYSSLQIPLVLSGNYSSVEFLYRYVIKVGFVIGQEQMVFVLTHLIILYYSYRAIKTNSSNYLFSIYIFMLGGFFNHSLNIMRQSMAIAIFLYAIKYIFKKDFVKYILHILLAFLFHKTALIFVPLYFVYYFKFNLRRACFLLIGTSLSIPLLKEILLFISLKYNVYKNYVNVYFEPEPLSGSYLFINIVISIVFLYVYFLKGKNFNRKESFYGYIQVITLCVLLCHSIIPNYDRIMFMMYSCQILSVPYLIKNIDNKTKKIIVISVILFSYLFIFYRIYIIQNIGKTFPYQSIL